LPVGAVGDQCFDDGHDLRVGRFAQGDEKGLGVAHVANLRQNQLRVSAIARRPFKPA